MTGVITVMAEKTLKQLMNDEARMVEKINKLSDQVKAEKNNLSKLKVVIKAKKAAEKAKGSVKKASAKKSVKKSTKKAAKKR